jgi:hypothetical protein
VRYLLHRQHLIKGRAKATITTIIIVAIAMVMIMIIVVTIRIIPKPLTDLMMRHMVATHQYD